MTNFNDLVDDCILAIFDYVPVQSLLVLGSICLRWDTLQREACRRRRTLVLLIGEDASSLITQSRFTIPYIDEHVVYRDANNRHRMWGEAHRVQMAALECCTIHERSVHWLADTFPHIKTLYIALRHKSWAL